MPFTPPNRYWPREDWEQLLITIGPATGSWQFDLVVYQQWRRSGRPMEQAWTDLRMTPENARKALLTALPEPTNQSGLIPPEIFSRLLARSRATEINGDDVAEDAILEPAPTAVA